MLYYTKYATPIRADITLPITLIGTGSEGNSIVIDPFRLMIDVGFAYGKITEHVNMDQVDFVALTHEHMDHLKISTLKRFVKRHPHLVLLMPERVWDFIQNKDPNGSAQIEHRVQPFPFDKPFLLETRDKSSYIITPHSTNHGDITNVAYEITDEETGTHMLYATDLDTFDEGPDGFPSGLPQSTNDPFNLIFLEANYDEEVLSQYIREKTALIREKEMEQFTGGSSEKELKTHRNHLFRAKSNWRHVSEQEAIHYIGKHLTPGGLFIPMHASRTFGTYFQDMAEE